MSFFNKIGEKIAQTSQSAAQITKNTAETLKLKSMISDEEKGINNMFKQIGKTYYETCGESPDQCFAQLIADIKGSEEKIAKYNEQINQLKGVINCQECGAEIPEGASFCCACGSAVQTAPVEDLVSDSLCEACGFAISADSLFCTNCGYKFEPPVDSPPVEPEVDLPPVEQVPDTPVHYESVYVEPDPAPAPDPAPDIEETVEEIVEETEVLNPIVQCSGCKSEIAVNNGFCLNCGQKFDEEMDMLQT